MAPGEQPPQMAAGQTPEGALSTLMICQELMGGENSQAAKYFYEQANATGNQGGGFAWVIQEGNENLKS